MRGLGLVLAGIVLAMPARGTTSYNSLASMQSSNPGLSFQNLDFGAISGNANSFLIESGDLDFIFQASQTNGVSKDTPPGTWPAGTRVRTSVGLASITLTLPSEVIAFGASFGWITGGFDGVTTITVAGNNAGAFSYQLVPASSATPAYLGVVGTESFSTLTLTIGSSLSAGQFGLNNFSFALAPEDPGEIPEPGTLALIGTGLIMVPLLKRLRRRR